MNNNTNMEIFHSKKAKRIAAGILLLIAALLVFRAGMVVGFRQARFSYQLGEHYYRDVMNIHNGPGGDFFRKDMINGDGTVGKIIKINDSSIIVSDQSGAEKTINIASTTAIKKGPQNIGITDMHIDDVVTVLGSASSSGLVEAKLIRVLPAPSAQ